jgi:hypothetical protein
MKKQMSRLLLAACASALAAASSFAQSPERSAANRGAPDASRAPAATDPVASEVALLRRTLQTLFGEKSARGDAERGGDALKERQDRIAHGLDLLARAEQRAGTLRKELLETTEKETGFRTRLMQIEEEIRPESIERATSVIGGMRAPELRDSRRRMLENERRGVESLISQTAQSRTRLEDDVRQADALVERLRRRVLPLIDREIEKIEQD